MFVLLTIALATVLFVAEPAVAGSLATSAARATARADFNGDGFGDLAIGVAQEDVGSVTNAGAVTVLYGSPTGLSATGGQFWNQDSPGVADSAEADDSFGYILAAGDFDGDGVADLAVGVPGEDVASSADAGAVNVLYGSPTGLSGHQDDFWHQDVAGVAGDGAEPHDQFGLALTAANFGKGGWTDLAVGANDEDVGAIEDAGAVNVLYGSSRGLSTVGDQFWHQGKKRVAGNGPQAGDRFGWTLAAANFGKGAQADLVAGVPFEDVGAITDAGAANVLYGSSRGLSAVGDQFLHQARRGMAGDGAEPDDEFGFALTAANFGKGPEADLAVSALKEDLEAAIDTGAVNVLYGSSGGLSTVGDQFWHQGVSGFAGDGPETGDSFGWALAAADFGKGVEADLAVGASFENIGGVSDAGSVSVLYGGASGLSTVGNQFWHQGVAGVPGEGPAQDNKFGFALAALNFGEGSRADLAVGAPFEDVDGVFDAGAVGVLYGSSAGLAVAGSQLWDQASAGIAGDGIETLDWFGLTLGPRR